MVSTNSPGAEDGTCPTCWWERWPALTAAGSHSLPALQVPFHINQKNTGITRWAMPVFWCGRRDLPACGRSGGAEKQSPGLFFNTHPSSPCIYTRNKGTIQKDDAFVWCGRRDLNPYGVIHTPLKRARLPVPPLPRVVIDG